MNPIGDDARVAHLFVAAKRGAPMEARLEVEAVAGVGLEGDRLNGLVGKRFRIGAVLLEGAELCEPCTLFARRTHREALKHFPGKGGLRAKVIEGGTIRAGDRLHTDVFVNFPARGESDVRALAHDKTHPSEGT